MYASMRIARVRDRLARASSLAGRGANGGYTVQEICYLLHLSVQYPIDLASCRVIRIVLQAELHGTRCDRFVTPYHVGRGSGAVLFFRVLVGARSR